MDGRSNASATCAPRDPARRRSGIDCQYVEYLPLEARSSQHRCAEPRHPSKSCPVRFRDQSVTTKRHCDALTRALRWSWGESNPRPSAGGRTRYDRSRLRGCRCLTGGSAGGPRGFHPRPVFAGCQPSFRPSVVFPTVILRFCCRAAADRPRAALLLTMTLHLPEIRRRERTASLAILVGAPFSESEQLGSRSRPSLLTSKPVSPVS